MPLYEAVSLLIPAGVIYTKAKRASFWLKTEVTSFHATGS